MDVVWDGKLRRRRDKILKHTTQKEKESEGTVEEPHRVGSRCTTTTTSTTTTTTTTTTENERKRNTFLIDTVGLVPLSALLAFVPSSLSFTFRFVRFPLTSTYFRRKRSHTGSPFSRLYHHHTTQTLKARSTIPLPLPPSLLFPFLLSAKYATTAVPPHQHVPLHPCLKRSHLPNHGQKIISLLLPPPPFIHSLLFRLFKPNIYRNKQNRWNKQQTQFKN